MKTMFRIFGIITIAVIIGFFFTGCKDLIGSTLNPPEPEPSTELGSISGRALFTNSETHTGITVTLEKTDGPRSLGAVFAARSINDGFAEDEVARSINTGRTIISGIQTGADGAFSFADLEAGWYTVYASSQNSKERAVAINVPLAASQSVTNVQLNLTPVGSISGRIRLNSSQTYNSGFLVCVAGTSYMAMTDNAGNFTISDVPAAANTYLIIIMKGNTTFPWSALAVSVEGGKPTQLGTKELTGEDIIDSFITISADGYWVINGVKTAVKAQGEQGEKGDKGDSGTPGSILSIGANGNWHIDGVDTGIKAQGEQGADGSTPVITIIDGYWYVDGVTTSVSAIGQTGVDGHTPLITIIDGYWHVDGESTGVSAIGQTGADGHTPLITIIDGFWHVDGESTGVSAIGQTGANGHTPVVTIIDGYWHVDGENTGVSAIGQTGSNGHTPVVTIIDGYWHVDGEDTGVSAIGQTGADGHTPLITIIHGYWYVDGESTGVSAIGQTGADGHTSLITIIDGFWHVDGVTTGVSAIGQTGATGHTPLITIIDGYWHVDGESTSVSAIGQTGANGHTPLITIIGGYWHVDGENTGISALGEKGADGKIDSIITIVDGYWYIDHVNTGVLAAGQQGPSGHTPEVTIEGGYWHIDGVSTGVSAIGQTGENGHTPEITIEDGYWYIDGANTGVPTTGANGINPHIGGNGNWWVGTTDTGVQAQGEPGLTPHIGPNNNWWIGTADTGILALGQDGTIPHIGTDGNWWIGNTNTGVKAQGDPGTTFGLVVVSFTSNGGSIVHAQIVEVGKTAVWPQNPTRGNHTFDNWYSDPSLSTVYNFATPITTNIMLYAKWNIISTDPRPWDNSTVIQMTPESWANGLLGVGGEQWFRFTATSNNHSIHIRHGNIGRVNYQLYHSSGTTEGGSQGSGTSAGQSMYITRQVTIGQEYYVRVWPASGSGSYQIAFNTQNEPPLYIIGSVTTLSAGSWADGLLGVGEVGGEQWFRFIATTSDNQSIHIRHGNIGNVNYQLYHSSGATVGGSQRSGTSAGQSMYITHQVTIGQEYYVRVWQNTSSGSYQIAFNTSNEPPLYIIGSVTMLSAGSWADGLLGVGEAGGEQWFRFIATTSGNQSIHIRHGNIGRVNYQMYHSSGVTVGSSQGSGTSAGQSMYISRQVTIGQEYYVRVWPASGSGSYQIALNTSNEPPLYIIGSVTMLSAGSWADGLLGVGEAGGEQWFRFTATTSDNHSIHIRHGSIGRVNYQLYHSSGATVGGSQGSGTSAGQSMYISRYVTIGQEYYVRVWPASGNGSYQIAFNMSTTPPN